MSADFEFTDNVMEFGSDGRTVGVLFTRQAAGYHLSIESAEFGPALSALAASWKERKPVKVSVRGTEILQVRPA